MTTFLVSALAVAYISHTLAKEGLSRPLREWLDIKPWPASFGCYTFDKEEM